MVPRRRDNKWFKVLLLFIKAISSAKIAQIHFIVKGVEMSTGSCGAKFEGEL
jgi:hypothetical protein